ncbi:MAG: sulfotransferase [Pseudomonadota bacterium]
MIKDIIVIIGAMKSGSTTLFAQLDAHPLIVGANPKEAGFFAFEEVHCLGWDWFEGLFDWQEGTSRYALDGTTDYTKAPFTHGVQDRFRAAEAEGRRFKFLYIMRHPVDRIASHAKHVAASEHKEVGQFRSPRRDHSLDAGLSAVNLAVSDYAGQLERYQEWFYRGDLHLLTLEQLVSDGETTMEGVAKFLGLPDLTLTEEKQHENAGGTRTKDNPLWGQMSNIGGLKAVAKTVVPQSARKKLRDSLRQKVEIEGRFTFTEHERQELNERFAPQAQLLQERYGFDPKWTFG